MTDHEPPVPGVSPWAAPPAGHVPPRPAGNGWPAPAWNGWPVPAYGWAPAPKQPWSNRKIFAVISGIGVGVAAVVAVPLLGVALAAYGLSSTFGKAFASGESSGLHQAIDDLNLSRTYDLDSTVEDATGVDAPTSVTYVFGRGDGPADVARTVDGIAVNAGWARQVCPADVQPAHCWRRDQGFGQVLVLRKRTTGARGPLAGGFALTARSWISDSPSQLPG